MTDTRTEALFLASLGWKLVPMLSGTKNPGNILGAGWQHQCSSDPAQISRWLMQNPDCNLGVLLGPSSGIIDVEYDSEQGEQILEEYCEGIVTCAYRSAKSVHRLFQYDERFEPEGAKFGAFGTEWRFGQDSAQSVIPPSLHETGARYQWLPGLSPREVQPIRLPDSLWNLLLNLKKTEEAKLAKRPENQVPARYYTGDSLLNKARKFVEETYSWEVILSGDGWTFCRNRSGAQDWWRPGKTKGSISGTVNYGGSGTIRIFSTSCSPLKEESSYDKFAYLCITKYQDDPVQAARDLLPDDILHAKPVDEKPVDLSGILGTERSDDFDDEEFCRESVPESGLLKEIYDFYCMTAHRKSDVMGLAVAVSLCQTIFGRRVSSHTGMRTNDYNVIMAPTSSGKEACESTIASILMAADPGRMPMIPPDVQSGNGLLKAIATMKYGIWVCDEFGKTLEAVLDRKGNNAHAKQIGTHLLKLYGKSNGIYGGAAHADGVRNQIIEPHLCVLGLTTGQVFESIDSRQIQDGLFGRLAFWPVQNRPKRRTAKTQPVSESLSGKVRCWIQWEPTSFNPEYPDARILEMTGEALQRWEHHADAIDEKMQHENESRAAIWGRVAARAMKLALVSRCSRIASDPLHLDWQFVKLELCDVNWGIRIANWLARIACGLIRENVVDVQAQRAQTVLVEALKAAGGEIDRTTIMREFRSISGPEFTAAAETLANRGLIEICEVPTRGRKRVVYRVRGQTA